MYSGCKLVVVVVSGLKVHKMPAASIAPSTFNIMDNFSRVMGMADFEGMLHGDVDQVSLSF